MTSPVLATLVIAPLLYTKMPISDVVTAQNAISPDALILGQSTDSNVLPSAARSPVPTIRDNAPLADRKMPLPLEKLSGAANAIAPLSLIAGPKRGLPYEYKKSPPPGADWPFSASP